MNEQLTQRIGKLSKQQQELLALLLNNQSNEITERPSKNTLMSASSSQKRLWRMYKDNPNSAITNMSVALRLKGVLQVNALVEAIKYLVNRHEVLKVSFKEEGEEVLQVIKDITHYKISILEQADNAFEREEQILDYIEREIKTPFNLENDFLLRPTLIKLKENEHILVLVMHHSVFDGWSGGVFFNELSEVYKSLAANREPKLPPLAIQYDDYSYWERQYLTSKESNEEYNFWKETLGNEYFNYLLETETEKEFKVDFEVININNADSLKLKKLSNQKQISLFMTLFSLYSLSLSKYFGKEKFIIGTPVAGRIKDEIENLVGMFVNTILLNVSINNGDSIDEVIERTKNTVSKALDHQTFPIEDLLEKLSPHSGQAKRSPIFQTVFALQNAPSGNIDFGDIEVSLVKPKDAPPLHQLLEFYSPVKKKLDISLVLGEKNGEIVGLLEYNKNLIDQNEAQQIKQIFYKQIKELIK
ncbi:condensation domain-containing protein [Priestia megaterium]|uniref:condensation domain-containing protein n=1 Tax=Priestia megaterium TaxID=1404 RepID=UPI0035E34F7F